MGKTFLDKDKLYISEFNCKLLVVAMADILLCHYVRCLYWVKNKPIWVNNRLKTCCVNLIRQVGVLIYPAGWVTHLTQMVAHFD